MNIRDVKIRDRIRWNKHEYAVMSIEEGDGTLLCKSDAPGSESVWISVVEVELCNTGSQPADAINHPPHYTQHPSGFECIAITEAFNFNVGNAIKYLWRAGLKGAAVEDLRKAAWYVQREIERRERGGK